VTGVDQHRVCLPVAPLVALAVLSWNHATATGASREVWKAMKRMADDNFLKTQRADADLLDFEDAPAVAVVNPKGLSPFLLVGDHAGNRIPKVLGTLGLSDVDRVRHIAWDIGVGALGKLLAARLDAVFVRQTYSRLVIDCNRDPASPDAIPAVSDGTAIPGNAGLSDEARAMRVAAIHAPYQAAINAEITRRQALGWETILVSLHSFTPMMAGVGRPWEIGVLHNGANNGFALALLDRLLGRDELIAADNEPYRMDATDYTVPRHAFAAGLAYAELEIRQDLLEEAGQIETWAELLVEILGSR
jgi:predicted N-formylglutamate amidohydrolase